MGQLGAVAQIPCIVYCVKSDRDRIQYYVQPSNQVTRESLHETGALISRMKGTDASRFPVYLLSLNLVSMLTDYQRDKLIKAVLCFTTETRCCGKSSLDPASLCRALKPVSSTAEFDHKADETDTRPSPLR